MIRVVLQQLVIFLLPIVFYGLYFAYQRRRARRSGAAAPRWEDGPWFWLIFGGALLSVGAFVAFALLKSGHPNVLYVPPSGPQ
jgi:phosphoglycerol transferase MdoB-like AlkP superfamily enzyme